MNKSGIGVGSASIILMFAVLCLSVFALISLSTATSDKAMAETAVDTVITYYETDMLAESILAEILAADIIPESIQGVDITINMDWDILAEIVSFSCPMSDSRELYVEIALNEDTYDILKWKTRNIGDSVIDDELPVWSGEDISDLWLGE